ncbi:single-stranded DNA-binding protein [Haloplasma contractile]|uniref:Single-stranded DNA-binding protein n=1 Tax=Haloplasma contractile SSD-17B TaxID=1033810 RepID=U2DZE5_9MOLU|nr:single-stranded DNA-binding protein [Haloplasma contractile]ERJ13572.1 Single-stranded DNA-binding protein SsbB [Haloplasma contractile SSD-17B]
MLNQVVLVGRLVKDPELRYTNDNKQVTNVTLAVNRSFKNVETGEYDTDFIRCTLWSGIAQTTTEYCSKGSVIGVKGRLVTRYQEFEPNKRINYPEVIAEKVTFISTNNKKNEELPN